MISFHFLDVLFQLNQENSQTWHPKTHIKLLETSVTESIAPFNSHPRFQFLPALGEGESTHAFGETQKQDKQHRNDKQVKGKAQINGRKKKRGVGAEAESPNSETQKACDAHVGRLDSLPEGTVE